MTFVRTDSDQTVTHQAGGLAVSLTGGQVPIVEIELDAGQGIVCTLTAVMQRDAVIGIRSWPGASDAMRLLVNEAQEGSARITLGNESAGKAGVFDLERHGGRLLCPQYALLAAGPGVMTSVYSRYRNLGPAGLDIMQLEGSGQAVLRACGEVKNIRLVPGEHAVVSATAICALSATIDLDPLEQEDIEGFVQLTGPGQVWLQSGVPPT